MISSSKSNAVSMTFTYSRLLNSGDGKHDVVIKSNTTQLGIWAFGTLVNGEFSKHTYSGKANITLPTTYCHDSSRYLSIILALLLINF